MFCDQNNVEKQAAWRKGRACNTRSRSAPYNKSIILFPKAKEKKLPQRYGDARRISAVKYKLFSFPWNEQSLAHKYTRAACYLHFFWQCRRGTNEIA
jgi:hypothetical protein